MIAWIMAWAPDVAQKQRPDDLGPLAPLLIGLVIVLTVLPLIWATRYELRKRKGLPTESPRRSSFGTAIGNAFFDVGSALDPNRPDIETIARIEEEGIEDEAGDGRDPERPRPPVRPKPEPPRPPKDESGPDRARTFKPEGDPADALNQRGDDLPAPDRAPLPLPPSMPRQ